MSIAIRYYTKSGNTEKLANAVGEELQLPVHKVDVPLDEKVDILLLGSSYYAFDMDPEVKEFIRNNKDKITKIVHFGTSAMVKSMIKPIKKVAEPLGIEVSNEEFHCFGSFGKMHKNRPDADDVAAVKAFASQFKNEI